MRKTGHHSDQTASRASVNRKKLKTNWLNHGQLWRLHMNNYRFSSFNNLGAANTSWKRRKRWKSLNTFGRVHYAVFRIYIYYVFRRKPTMGCCDVLNQELCQQIRSIFSFLFILFFHIWQNGKHIGKRHRAKANSYTCVCITAPALTLMQNLYTRIYLYMYVLFLWRAKRPVKGLREKKAIDRTQYIYIYT